VLAVHDVFLFTSLSEEPIARTVMEAMAAGLAVIATPVGGQVEMLEEGANVLTFPPGDPAALAGHIQRLLDDPTLLRRLAAAGRQTVLQRFTVRRMVDEYEAWLEEIVACASSL
jgi:glycosyltransferase involved in cell wall biosynthesis